MTNRTTSVIGRMRPNAAIPAIGSSAIRISSVPYADDGECRRETARRGQRLGQPLLTELLVDERRPQSAAFRPVPEALGEVRTLPFEHVHRLAHDQDLRLSPLRQTTHLDSRHPSEQPGTGAAGQRRAAGNRRATQPGAGYTSRRSGAQCHLRYTMDPRELTFSVHLDMTLSGWPSQAPGAPKRAVEGGRPSPDVRAAAAGRQTTCRLDGHCEEWTHS